jgi:hypothetical protein
MAETLDRIKALVEYARALKGDEKGEAQVFCDRLFQGFGHAGYKEAGATLEFRVKQRGALDEVCRSALASAIVTRDEKSRRKAPEALQAGV